MSKDNYDDWAAFCGPKGFYDLDGSGHLDGFEAAMMIGDTVDEMNSSKRHSTPTSGTQPKEQKRAIWPWLFWIGVIIVTIQTLFDL